MDNGASVEADAERMTGIEGTGRCLCKRSGTRRRDRESDYERKQEACLNEGQDNEREVGLPEDRT